jgi:hypothetical protein
MRASGCATSGGKDGEDEEAKRQYKLAPATARHESHLPVQNVYQIR